MKKIRYLIIILLSCALGVFINLKTAKRHLVDTLDPSLVNALQAESIIAVQKLTIPGYSKAFNPSITPTNNGYLLAFRYSKRMPWNAFKQKIRKDASYIGLVELNSQFEVQSKTIQILKPILFNGDISLTAEDPRLIQNNGKIYLFYNDVSLSDGSLHIGLFFTEVIKEKNKYSISNPPKLLQKSGSFPVEKNWSPFFSDHKLYCIYSDDPRSILEVDINTGHCTEVNQSLPVFEWKWGQVRGGTPAELLDDYFITFFHSSIPALRRINGKEKGKGRNYVAGAYLFDKEFPFAIKAYTPYPLGVLEDYTNDNSKKIVFPGGLIIDEKTFKVVWGKNDRQIYITTFDKQKLIKSMTFIDS
jgi:predicted GH43/DUF377 family glycosyl hydrolase